MVLHPSKALAVKENLGWLEYKVITNKTHNIMNPVQNYAYHARMLWYPVNFILDLVMTLVFSLSYDKRCGEQ